MKIPRLVIAGLRGGGGKTAVSAGLAAALRARGLAVAPFKKGPDYIDAAWLSLAAGAPCRNLDLFLMDRPAVLASFARAARAADVALVEGNRGLYDGMDASGTYSTAELAKALRAPILLVVDCTKQTRTVAAEVLGCRRLDPRAPLRGVILNRISGARHEAVVREAVERYAGLPVVGALPRLERNPFGERHLGLVPPVEHAGAAAAVREAARAVRSGVDLDAVLRIARGAPAMAPAPERPAPAAPRVRIGVCRDAAFQFYYPDNLEALAAAGARLVEVSPLADAAVPDVDALYIGGGFPETAAEGLASNARFRASLRAAVGKGLPVYAECGGAVYLGRRLAAGGRDFPMAGVFPVGFDLGRAPQGHGYAVLEAARGNPFFEAGEVLRGHEFHYSRVRTPLPPGLAFAFRVRRGFGFDGRRDGLVRRNVLACFTHVHALGAAGWAPALVRAALRFREGARKV